MNSIKSIYKQKPDGQKVRVFDIVLDARGKIIGLHIKSGRNSSIDEIISLKEVKQQVQQNIVSES